MPSLDSSASSSFMLPRSLSSRPFITGRACRRENRVWCTPTDRLGVETGNEAFRILQPHVDSSQAQCGTWFTCIICKDRQRIPLFRFTWSHRRGCRCWVALPAVGPGLRCPYTAALYGQPSSDTPELSLAPYTAYREMRTRRTFCTCYQVT